MYSPKITTAEVVEIREKTGSSMVVAYDIVRKDVIKKDILKASTEELKEILIYIVDTVDFSKR